MKNSLQATAAEARDDAIRAMPTSLNLAGRGGPGSGRGELGDPYPIIRIGLDSLLNYRKGVSLYNFVPSEVSEVLYPVLVERELAGSITLERQESGDWKPTVFNNLGLTKALTEARQSRPANERTRSELYAGISARALGLSFLAVLLDSDGLFVPLASDDELELEVNVPIPSEKALALLSQLAKEYNGEPA